MFPHSRRLVVLAASVAALAGAPALAQPVMIVPGKAIGPFEIGMPLESARSMMESFGRVEEASNAGVRGFCNPDEGIGVCVFDRVARISVNTPGVVAYVVTDDPRFATDTGGHKVGTPLLDFLKTYGLYSAGQGSEIRWEGRGLAVSVTPEDRGIVIQLIAVYGPRTVSATTAPARH
jgi:hypothetical protein